MLNSLGFLAQSFFATLQIRGIGVYGQGCDPPLFLMDFVPFTLKDVICKINFKASSPSFSKLKVSLLQFFRASYASENVPTSVKPFFLHCRRICRALVSAGQWVQLHPSILRDGQCTRQFSAVYSLTKWVNSSRY